MSARTRHSPFMQALVSSMELVEERVSGSEPKPLVTGIPDLDEYLGELRPGELVSIAGRPGHGKTSLLFTVARAVSLRQGRRIALFQNEAGNTAAALRLISIESRVQMRSMASGTIREQQWSRLSTAVQSLASAPIHLSTDPVTSAGDVAEMAWEIKNAHGDLSAVFVDSPSTWPILKSGVSRAHHFTETVYELKRLARELETPVVVTTSIDRAVDSRFDKRPFLADIACSSAIEVASDVVLIMYRDDLYVEDSEARGEVEIHVVKNRMGLHGVISAAFLGNLGFIAGFSRHHQPA